MIPRLPVQCAIPDGQRDSDIRHLEIQAADGGFYLLQYVRLNEPPKWDSFYQSLDDVLSDCWEGWGIGDELWQEAEEP